MPADIYLEGDTAQQVNAGDLILLGIVLYDPNRRSFVFEIESTIPKEEAAALIAMLVKRPESLKAV